jgi:pyruvate/2-oxoglutarate dehydrogenase complex dihydrolipoamide dehydrogenase (E3) component
LGSRVTVVSLDDEVLPREDPEARRLVKEALERDGVRLCLGARVLRTEGDTLVFDRGQGEERVDSEVRLLAVGRVPNTEMGLEAAGVAFDEGGVRVDGRLRTSNRRIFAAGDVIGGGFTHAADAHARIVIRNAFFFGRARREDLVVPACTYTSPEVATVGRMEGTAFRVDLSEVDRAVLDGENEGFAKIWVADNGRILGATVVAQGAGELIAPAVLAMTEGLKLGALGGAIVPYPTRTDVWRRLSGAWMRTRLSERAKLWLRRWFRWLR